jgi:hypothetical protein
LFQRRQQRTSATMRMVLLVIKRWFRWPSAMVWGVVLVLCLVVVVACGPRCVKNRQPDVWSFSGWDKIARQVVFLVPSGNVWFWRVKKFQ